MSATDHTLPRLVIFTDLDGCLLNKQDYDFTPAKPVLNRIARVGISIVLSSSKTEAEMTPLADELGLSASHLICENGGVVIWREPNKPVSRDVLGTTRPAITEVLNLLRPDFQFRSFSDLGVEGVANTTNLPPHKAQQACDRRCTEPILFDGPEGAETRFKSVIEANGLTLTQGGRFWHVAGHTTKGAGMTAVLKRMDATLGKHQSIAIGDSPIDQSMLDIAEHPIGIPQPNGDVLVSVPDNGMIAPSPGSAGWAESVSGLFDRLGVPA